MPPKANAILAKLIVINVKKKSLNDFVYFVISKKIATLISVIHDNKIIILENNTILEIKIISRDKKTEIGRIG